MSKVWPVSSLVSNSGFLAELASAAPTGTVLWVNSFIGSPDLGPDLWGGRPYNVTSAHFTVDTWGMQNTYFSVAALKAGDGGSYDRRKANFSRLLALVADDADLDGIRGSVSWVLETSPGKRQIGVLLAADDPDCADALLVERLVNAMAANGLVKADRAGNNIVRYVRLPVGQNQKPRESGHWAHHLEAWKPEVRLSLDDAAAVFGVDLDDVRAAASAQPGTSLITQDDNLRSLTSKVIAGDNLHDSLNMIAASLVATGMPGGAVVNLLRGLMDASQATRDERFLARYQDIPRSVRTAQDKYERAPTPLPVVASDLVLDMKQLNDRSEAVRWAVKGLIPSQGVGFMFGASQTFKSFVMLDYALHRTYGLKWLGLKTQQAIPVYIAAEGGTGLTRRIKAWHQARGLDWLKCPMRVVVVPLTLRTQSNVLREAIEALGLAIGDVIIDTMSQTFTGSENSNDEVAEFLRILGTELRDALKCTVFIVHHTGHSSSDRPRGASAITDNSDFAFGVFREDKEMLTTVEFTKVKDGERPEPASFELTVQHLGIDEDGDSITSLSAAHINNAEALITAMAKESTAGRSGHNGVFMSLIQNGMQEKELRKLFYDHLGSAEVDTKKHAFNRGRKWAIKAGLIEIAQGTVIVLKEFK